MSAADARPTTIVVGVSARTGSPAALRWAADRATRLDARVLAVMAWRRPRPPAAPGGHPPVVASTGGPDPEQEAADRLAALVAEVLGPDHGVQCLPVHGAAVAVLTSASRDADLLVLDPPRPTGRATVSERLVAPQLIFRSACPVVVMPTTTRDGAGGRVRAVTQRLAEATVSAVATAGRPGLRFPPATPPPSGDLPG